MLTIMWFILGLAAVFAYLWINRPRRPPNFPPGPPTFLVFGNLSETLSAIGGGFVSTVTQLQEKHGKEIVGLVDPLGRYTVHVFDPALIREAAGLYGLAGRTQTFGKRYRLFWQNLGVLSSEGALWQEHRRFALKHLRDLGFGKNRMASSIQGEFEFFAKELTKLAGQRVRMDLLFNIMILNVTWKLIASKRYEIGDPKAKRLIELINDFTRVAGPQNVLNFFPWLRFLFPQWSTFSLLSNARNETTRMFRDVIKEHRSTLDPDNPRDYVDAFLLEMQKPDAEQRGFSELNLTVLGMDFFVAGEETTSASLTWAVLLVSLFPAVQRAVQSEVDRVVGRNRLPQPEDRLQMPYTEAVMAEVLRYANVLPHALVHRASFGPVQLGGYTLPHGTEVILHIVCMHQDKKYWGDPENFRPERFLTEDGKFRKDDHLAPFGVGKRSCLGESLARMEFFVVFTSLLQRFNLRLPDGPRPSSSAEHAIIRIPHAFDVIPELRE